MRVTQEPIFTFRITPVSSIDGEPASADVAQGVHVNGRTCLKGPLRAELKKAVENAERSQRAFAEEIGVRQAGLSEFLNGKQDTLPTQPLKQLVALLGLESERFFPQLELELDDELISKVTEQVRTHLEELRAETPILRGTGFQGFIAIRVSGNVDKSFEGVFPLGPTPSQ